MSLYLTGNDIKVYENTQEVSAERYTELREANTLMVC
ncbi:MAG: hypothetical protein JWP57_417 [Spirosoma sp.]|nr:hypothetical protein [Spirosoma sp.]